MQNIQDKRVTDKIKFVQDTLYVINGKWKLPIIIAVYYGNSRFTDLKKCIPNITSRVLSKELKELEANKLIKRSLNSDFPHIIKYTLNDYSFTLDPIIKAMANWGEQHRKKISEE
ncbi:MAG: winged helix-turn-helix transcriptional regulator [Flavobacterium sp.]|nr:winged helix-turn-helix transcriptional regulator [Flavobacterium sp.]